MEVENLNSHFIHATLANEDTRKFLIAFDEGLISDEKLFFWEKSLEITVISQDFYLSSTSDLTAKDTRNLYARPNWNSRKMTFLQLPRIGFAMTVHKSSGYTAVKLLKYNT